MISSTLCYIEKDGKYLMHHRVKKEHDANKDKWIGVGGRFEEGESPEDCVCRETLEETGLTLTDYTYRGIVTFVSDKWEGEFMHLFTATGFEGDETIKSAPVVEKKAAVAAPKAAPAAKPADVSDIDEIFKIFGR